MKIWWCHLSVKYHLFVARIELSRKWGVKTFHSTRKWVEMKIYPNCWSTFFCPPLRPTSRWASCAKFICFVWIKIINFYLFFRCLGDPGNCKKLRSYRSLWLEPIGPVWCLLKQKKTHEVWQSTSTFYRNLKQNNSLNDSKCLSSQVQ